MRNNKQIIKLSKLAEKVQRYTKKEQEKNKETYKRKYIAGAYYIDNTTQITDGSWGLVLNDKIEHKDLVFISGKIGTFDLRQYNKGDKVKVDLKELYKNELGFKNEQEIFIEKLNESINNENEWNIHSVIKIGTNYYNAKLVLEITKCFDEFELEQIMFAINKEYSMLVVKNGLDWGIILPLRKDDVEEELKRIKEREELKKEVEENE